MPTRKRCWASPLKILEEAPMNLRRRVERLERAMGVDERNAPLDITLVFIDGDGTVVRTLPISELWQETASSPRIKRGANGGDGLKRQNF